MNNSLKLGVALVKRACPICGSIKDAEIIMNSVLSKEAKESVENLHGKCVRYLDHACEKCSEHSEALYIVGIDPTKSEKNNIYRTGQIVGIRKGCDLAKLIEENVITLEDNMQFCYMEEEAGRELGLWK